MKRGLKARIPEPGLQEYLRCTNYPDEKGTESFTFWAPCIAPNSCTNYPDEKGTERSGLNAGAYYWLSCTNYPDEKGTERGH